ncbi:MAG: F-type H+-transporting ATPase subunit delta [Clostridiales bacterium]|jgi:F-type H+-transporting ATPase subunit delta|nr:F-type H+-transporting ATPase subunit delta [Clostridiales bacterium]
MNSISKRYAQALLLIAQEKDALTAYEQQLKECSCIIQSNKAIYEILSNPENSHAIKVNLLNRLFGNSVSKDILNLLKLLIDKKRLNLLNDILMAYKEGVHAFVKSLDVNIISAFPLTSDEMDRIKSKLKEKYNVSEVNLIPIIDESLIGGFKLVIGNQVIDQSIKGMMHTLKNQIITKTI